METLPKDFGFGRRTISISAAAAFQTNMPASSDRPTHKHRGSQCCHQCRQNCRLEANREPMRAMLSTNFQRSFSTVSLL